jgi:hypothetical protein
MYDARSMLPFPSSRGRSNAAADGCSFFASVCAIALLLPWTTRQISSASSASTSATAMTSAPRRSRFDISSER